MDFADSPEHAAFRREFRAWLEANLTEDLKVEDAQDQRVSPDREILEKRRTWQKKMHAAGWVGLSWPKEYGGRGASFMQQVIFDEEYFRARAPILPGTVGMSLLGPTLIHWGTEEQKKRYLPKILSCDEIWCQGYSEPGAGSDLASLRTRAVDQGDHFLVNGQKVWTSGAHHADWCFLLVRTDPDAPKHKGISFLLADMKSPGITVRPIVNMAGYHEFNEVFFEDVRIPVANRVGEENNGWYVAMTLLDFERSNVASISANQRQMELLIGDMKKRKPGGVYRDILRHRLAEMWLANETGRLLSYRTAWMQETGKIANYEASVIKVFATELAARITNFGVNQLGPAGALEPESPYAIFDGNMSKGHLVNVSPLIYSGSSEIQRNIIATRGLGLPRD